MSLDIAENTDVDMWREEDARLVLAAQSGDTEAFAELFGTYRGMVSSIARQKLGDLQEAEDLCQEVFMQAFRKIETIKEPQKFKGWIATITSRMAINFHVRRKDKQFENSSGSSPLYEGEDRQLPNSFMISEEVRDQVWKSLNRLKPLDRDSLKDFYMEGMSLNEMVEASAETEDKQTPQGTFKRRLHTARNRLRTIILDTTDIIDSPQSKPRSDGPAHVA